MECSQCGNSIKSGEGATDPRRHEIPDGSPKVLCMPCYEVAKKEAEPDA